MGQGGGASPARPLRGIHRRVTLRWIPECFLFPPFCTPAITTGESWQVLFRRNPILARLLGEVEDFVGTAQKGLFRVTLVVSGDSKAEGQCELNGFAFILGGH